MGKVVDLESMFKQMKAENAGAPPPDMARGIDLAIVRDKHKHQHSWCVVGKYSISTEQLDEIVAAMDAAMADMRDKQALGEPVELVSIPIPMEQDQLMGVDGPGCVKCGLHFTHEKGRGVLCEISDDRVQPIQPTQVQVQ